MHNRPHNCMNDHKFTSSEQIRCSACSGDDYDCLENGQLSELVWHKMCLLLLHTTFGKVSALPNLQLYN